MTIRYRTILLIAATTVSHLFWLNGKGEGFNDNAHRNLSERAVDPVLSTNPSILDNFLKTTLGFEFQDGINTLLHGGEDGTVKGQIQFGSTREDAGLRPRSHFHNPRLSWDQAGLTKGLLHFQSSIVWAQNPSQFAFEQRSWQDARNYYFQALTATSASERKRLYAETFRTLGHQIHHVQDAATPAHTRNDWHLCVDKDVFCPNPDEFHFWGETDAGQAVINGSNPPPFDKGLFDQSSPNLDAPIPIARIIDSKNDDIGPLALVPGVSIGLAEYSSANFFSDHTVNSQNFYSPHSSQVEVREPEDDLSLPPKKRPYVYFLPGFGEQDYPLALASAMVNYVTDPFAIPNEKGLDGKVFQGYGAKLFPRAIGYSAGLIDYFFRGSINADAPLYESAPPGNPPTTITPTNVANTTMNEETGNGTLRYVLQYDSKFNTSESFPLYLVSGPVSRNINRDIQNVTFPFSFLPFPATMGPDCNPGGSVLCSSSVYYHGLIIYRGPLGGEDDTVIVRRCSVALSRVLPVPIFGELYVELGGGEGC